MLWVPFQDGRLPGLRKHKLSCELFGTTNEVLDTGTYYESADTEETIVEDTGHHEYVDADGIPREIHVKQEAPPKRKKLEIKKVLPKVMPPPPARANVLKPPEYQYVTTTTHQQQQASPSSSRSLCKFADTARVWERKLEELPFPQALQLEKNINDMLYEAALSNLQEGYHQQAVIKVNIAPEHLEQHQD